MKYYVRQSIGNLNTLEVVHEVEREVSLEFINEAFVQSGEPATIVEATAEKIVFEVEWTLWQ
jgi:hypothetical protein